MDNSKIYDSTIRELREDYDNDILDFLKSLEERIEIGNYLNEKYANKVISSFPVNVAYLKKQKEILEGMV